MRNKYLGLILLFVLCLWGDYSMAQKGTQSPYSSYGIGELNRRSYASISGMGGVSVASTDSTVVNSNNPASYAFFSRNKPIFQVGLSGKTSDFSNATSSSTQRHFGLNQFQLGLPIKKNWGIGVGIKPYSFTGYTITNFDIVDQDTLGQAVSEGSGGIRIANLGLGYKPLNAYKKAYKPRVLMDSLGNVISRDSVGYWKTRTLSFGFNANYLFGTSLNTRSNEFLPSYGSNFNARVQNGIRMSGYTFEFGASYQIGRITATKNTSLSIAGSYTPAMAVRAFEDILTYSYVGSYYKGETTGIVDTIEFADNVEGKLYMPDVYKIGVEYRIGSVRGNRSMLRLAAEVNYETWSNFKSEFGTVTSDVNSMKDRLFVAAGIEWNPSTISGMRNNTTSFLSRLKYRVGVNYTDTELKINNNLGEISTVQDYGMSFGIGIPVSISNASTNINIGANFGALGSTENGLIKENYIGFQVGISITPGNGDYWFVKRKYD